MSHAGTPEQLMQ